MGEKRCSLCLLSLTLFCQSETFVQGKSSTFGKYVYSLSGRAYDKIEALASSAAIMKFVDSGSHPWITLPMDRAS